MQPLLCSTTYSPLQGMFIVASTHVCHRPPTPNTHRYPCFSVVFDRMIMSFPAPLSRVRVLLRHVLVQVSGSCGGRECPGCLPAAGHCPHRLRQHSPALHIHDPASAINSASPSPVCGCAAVHLAAQWCQRHRVGCSSGPRWVCVRVCVWVCVRVCVCAHVWSHDHACSVVHHFVAVLAQFPGTWPCPSSGDKVSAPRVLSTAASTVHMPS
jgi:hypothetical protein